MLVGALLHGGSARHDRRPLEGPQTLQVTLLFNNFILNFMKTAKNAQRSSIRLFLSEKVDF